MRKKNEINHHLAPSNPVRAVIYSWVATEENKRRLATDLKICREYAKREGLTVIAEFTDVGSGLRFERDGLTRMRALIADKSVAAIIIPTFTCLTRSVVHIILLDREFRALGIRVHIVGLRMEGRL